MGGIDRAEGMTSCYDLTTDSTESTNVAQLQPALTREMSYRMRARFTEGTWQR